MRQVGPRVLEEIEGLEAEGEELAQVLGPEEATGGGVGKRKRWGGGHGGELREFRAVAGPRGLLAGERMLSHARM